MDLNEHHKGLEIKDLFTKYYESRIDAIKAKHPSYTRDEYMDLIWHEFKKANKTLLLKK